jgi:hypothetical protein
MDYSDSPLLFDSEDEKNAGDDHDDDGHKDDGDRVRLDAPIDKIPHEHRVRICSISRVPEHQQ